MFTDIIWDFDGTLFDTYPSMTNALKKALKDYGVEETEQNILQYMKISLSEAIKYYTNAYGLDDKLIDKYRGYEDITPAQFAKPFPYAKDICKVIKDSGRHNFILTHRGGSTLKYLKAYGMESFFQEIVTKHNGFKRKPDPEGYLYLLNKYHIDKKNALIVGDRDIEILAGREAGIKVCLYDTNKVSCRENPDFIINSLKELSDIIFD